MLWNWSNILKAGLIPRFDSFRRTQNIEVVSGRLYRMESEIAEINALIGREVYSKNGISVGEVADVQISIEGEGSHVNGLNIMDVNEELFKGWDLNGKGIKVPYRWVRCVGDIIIVDDIIEKVASKDQTDE